MDRKLERANLIGRAHGMHECGRSDGKIAETLGVSKSTVRKWRINQFQFGRRRGSGRPRIVSSRSERQIVRTICSCPNMSCSEVIATLNLRVSRWTVRRTLRKLGLRSRKRSSAILLTQVHKDVRLRWAMRHCLWREPQWRRVVWTDEASVRLRQKDGRLRLWLRPDHKVPDELVVPMCQGGGSSVLIWGRYGRVVVQSFTSCNKQ